MGLVASFDAPRQKILIRELAKGTRYEEAIAMAGYTDPANAYHALSVPAVAKAIERGVRERLATVYGPKAMGVLYDLTIDERAHPAIRRAAAKDLVSLAGYVAPKAPDALGDDKSISSMSADELAQLVSKMEGELASRAKDVSAPNAPEVDSELSDMLG